jgi:hypothetical protein
MDPEKSILSAELAIDLNTVGKSSRKETYHVQILKYRLSPSAGIQFLNIALSWFHFRFRFSRIII